MNLKPNFEQYKRDQSRLEKIPTIKPDFHNVLDNLSGKIISNQELTIEEINDLEIIYNMTQNLEKESVVFLDRYRSENIITKSEFLITIDYFLMANQNGLDIAKIKAELLSNTVSSEDFGKLCEGIIMSSQTPQLFQRVYKKIKEHKDSSLK